jgi:cell wall-associated NlpC family hydrolase
MAIKGISVAYCAVGGIILFSGIKGSTLADTAKGLISGNISSIQDTEAIQVANGSGTTSGGTTSSSLGARASGSQILQDAMQYNGHKYVFGGPSNPTDGWDCSSFASYVLGHDLKMTLPGNQSWAAATNNGASHGPVASEFSNVPGFTKVSDSPLNALPGDLLVWTGHVGFSTGSGGMFSAFDTASGTLNTKASAPYGYEGTYRAH